MANIGVQETIRQPKSSNIQQLFLAVGVSLHPAEHTL